MTIIIKSERLNLRTWRKEDANVYLQINQDLKVIEFLGGSMIIEQVHDFINKTNEHQIKYNYCLWGVYQEVCVSL
jgi:hypothetical protein